MAAARALVERAARASTPTASTPVSAGSSRSAIPEELAEELQLRLLRSHACGVGEPYPDDVVRAAMLLRANALAKGYSGARVETVELLLACLERAASLPHVPARGSVGASGDLAPLAHLALPLVGEGEACVGGERLDGADALARAGLEPVALAAKEGLSLINGTQFMAAMAALGLVRARRLARVGRLSRARCRSRRCRARRPLHPADPRAAPARAARSSRRANVRALLEGSAIIESHRWCDKVQDAYSLRCAPQVHGATRDLLDYVECTVAIELNAATDNPLVLVEDEMLVSTATSTASRSPSRSTPSRWRSPSSRTSPSAASSGSSTRPLGRPPAVSHRDGGLNSGFMIPQYVAASLVSENKVLCHPASVDSIPTSAGQEDHVSMGNAAGLKALAGPREHRARARDRAAGGRAGGRVPRAARARARRRGDARVRAHVSARSGRPAAPPTSRRSRRHPRRVAGAAVEAEVGELGERSASRWERPVAALPSHPYRDTLLVYGGLSVVIVLFA